MNSGFSSSRGCRVGCDLNGVAQVFELTDRSLAGVGSLAVRKIVEAEVVVGCPLGEEVEGDDENLMAHGNHGTLASKPATEPLEFSPQIALLRTAGGPAGFDQGLAEPGIAFAGACAPSFASTLFIGGANSSPGCQVAYRRKVGQEVSAHLRNHDLSGPCAHPRNSVETFDLIAKRRN